MNTDLLAKPVSEIDFKQRLQLIADLLDDSPIKHVGLNEDLGVMVLGEDESTRPGSLHDHRQRAYFSFKPTRLVILDRRQESIDVEMSQRETSEPGQPWVTHIKETRQTRRIVDVPADAWSVHALYFGTRCGLGIGNVCRSIPGSAFVDGYRLSRDTVVQAGVDVSIRVSHSLQNDARFYALLFGVPVAS